MNLNPERDDDPRFKHKEDNKKLNLDVKVD